MADKQNMSGQQSLDIIHEMIDRAKGDIRSKSFYFILWGWIIIAGSIGHYLLLQFSKVSHPEWAWSVIIVGIIASIIQGARDRQENGAITYSERVYVTVWITFLVNYFIILFFIATINYYITPLILVMAAAATYISGTIIKFPPLKWGAVFIWGMGIIAFLVALPYQLLATAIAIFGGYLIPAYLLKNKEE